MALPTTYTASLPLKMFADSIIVAQALSGFLCLQELKSSYTAMTTANKNYFKTSPWQSKPLQFLLSQTSSIFLFLSLVFQDHKRDEFLASCCWSRQLLAFLPSAATLGSQVWHSPGLEEAEPAARLEESPMQAQLQAGDLQVFFHSVSTPNPVALQLVINTITPTLVQHGFFAAFHREESESGISSGGVRPPDSHTTKREGLNDLRVLFPYSSLPFPALSAASHQRDPCCCKAGFLATAGGSCFPGPGVQGTVGSRKDAIKTLC